MLAISNTEGTYYRYLKALYLWEQRGEQQVAEHNPK
jgi:hypothetical protein